MEIPLLSMAKGCRCLLWTPQRVPAGICGPSQAPSCRWHAEGMYRRLSLHTIGVGLSLVVDGGVKFFSVILYISMGISGS